MGGDPSTRGCAENWVRKGGEGDGTQTRQHVVGPQEHQRPQPHPSAPVPALPQRLVQLPARGEGGSQTARGEACDIALRRELTCFLHGQVNVDF